MIRLAMRELRTCAHRVPWSTRAGMPRTRRPSVSQVSRRSTNARDDAVVLPRAATSNIHPRTVHQYRAGLPIACIEGRLRGRCLGLRFSSFFYVFPGCPHFFRSSSPRRGPDLRLLDFVGELLVLVFSRLTVNATFSFCRDRHRDRARRLAVRGSRLRLLFLGLRLGPAVAQASPMTLLAHLNVLGPRPHRGPADTARNGRGGGVERGCRGQPALPCHRRCTHRHRKGNI